MYSKLLTLFGRRLTISILILVVAGALFLMTLARVQVGTAFTYQGQLLDGSGRGGQLLASDGDGGLTWQDAPPVKQLVQDFVMASGEEVSGGDVVAFLDSQGFDGSAEWGGESVFNAGSTYDIAVSALSASDFVVAYRDYGNFSNHGTAVVGTVSGGALSWGTASVFNAAATSDIAVSAMSETDFVVAYDDGGNGTVITGTVSGGALSWGTASVFYASWAGHIAVSALSATDFVVAYSDAYRSDYGTAVVGTLGGGALSWGTESVFNSAETYQIAVSALSASDFVVAYRDAGNSNRGTVITGTVSGGALSWGTASVFNAAPTSDIAISTLSASDFVVAYRDAGNSYYGTAIVGTLDGGALSWGSASVFNAADTNGIAVSALSATGFVVAYTDGGNSGYGTVITGMVGGGALSWGTEDVFNAADTGYVAVSTLSASDFVVAYCDWGNSEYGTAIVGTVGGGALSWGTASVFNAANTAYIAVSALSDSDFVIAYRDVGNSGYGTAITGRVSEGALSWGTESVFNADATYWVAVSALSATDFVVAYRDDGNSYYGTAITGTVSGGALSWGTESVFNATWTASIAVSALSASDFVVAYSDEGNSSYGTAITGTVSGGALSWGTESVFNSAFTEYIAVNALSARDFVVAYSDFSNSSYGTTITGTVGGGALSWGAASVFNAVPTYWIAVSALSASDFVVAYEDFGNFGYGTAITGTVGGGALSWGTESVFNADSTDNIAVSALSTTDFVVTYSDVGNSQYGTAITGTLDGGALSWGRESVFNPAETDFIAVSALSTRDFVVAYRDVGNSEYGTAIVGTVSVVEPNQAPYAPGNPTPPDGASDVPTNQALSWKGGDPDGDPVTYTVALGTTEPLSVVATGVISTSYKPGTLDSATVYYWAITATDGLSVAVGPVWSFTTAITSPVDTGYEPNDTCAQAFPIPTDGTVQVHAFQDEGDEDWVYFQATAGVTYVVEVRTPPASTADVRLEVYDSCDPGGSFDEDDPPLNPDIRLAFEAPTSGTYYLHLANNSSLYGPDAVYHLSVRALQDILPSGAVIIVAGRLREDDALQANIHYVTDAAYDLALTHGCAVTQVTYLATDTSLDGVTGRATVDNLEEAITQWAVDKVGPHRPLTLYLMDHGNYDLFYLDQPEGHQLTPIDLDDWLEQLEEAVAGVKVNVVIEACYSGSFIDKVKSVSSPGRVVIASTSNAARAYASQDGATFSDSFFNVLRQGMTLGLSFYEGKWAAEQGHPDQQPWLDDDGDGVANEAEDGRAAARRTLACGVFPPELNWPPHISQAEVRNLSGGHGEVWAKVQDDERVKWVWAVVYPPSYQTPAPGEEMIREPLPITLKHQGEGWYGGTEQFDETGDYRVVVYAEDYEALRARPLEVRARTGWAVYLPLVMRRD